MEAGAAGLVIGKSYIQPSFLCIRQEIRFVLICVYQICGARYAASDMRHQICGVRYAASNMWCQI